MSRLADEYWGLDENCIAVCHRLHRNGDMIVDETGRFIEIPPPVEGQVDQALLDTIDKRSKARLREGYRNFTLGAFYSGAVEFVKAEARDQLPPARQPDADTELANALRASVPRLGGVTGDDYYLTLARAARAHLEGKTA
jgi:hypothetical protein